MKIGIITSNPNNTVVQGVVKALSETVVITLPAGCSTVALQVKGTWVGQLDFQGSVDGVDYDPIEASNGNATVNATAANDIFILPGAGYAKVRVISTAWTSGRAIVMFVATLGAASSILTGSLPAGANVIGKVGIDQTTSGTTNKVVASDPPVVETPFTGAGDLVVGTHKLAPGAAFKLTEIELHLNAAPTTGAQNLVISLDDGVAPAYDLVILTIDLVANAVADLVIKPKKTCKSTDVITVSWTNTDGKTYGLKFKHQLM